MPIVWMIVFGIGGGILNALIVDKGLKMPRFDTADGETLWRPGFIGNLIIGGAGAVIIGGLYGPLGAADIGGQLSTMHFTLANAAASVLTGAGGARVITQEVDKRYSRAKTKNLASTVQDLSKVR
jgi:hypothetical protein